MNPLSRLRRQLPQGDALWQCRKVPRQHKSRPLGEGGCERSEQTEGVFSQQKRLLHIPCNSLFTIFSYSLRPFRQG